jgi:acyl-CoA synthetase (NDP forming)
MEGAMVQAMAAPGVETMAGVVRDPAFGPLVLFGMGGTVAELLGDHTERVAPLARSEAADMVRGLCCSPLLTGYRGAPPADLAALEDVLARLGALASEHPRIAELDLNPVVASTGGAVAVDARIRVEQRSPAASDLPVARHLPRPRPEGDGR